MPIRNTEKNLRLAVNVSFMPPSLIEAALNVDSNFIGSYASDGTKDNFPDSPAITGPDDFWYLNAIDDDGENIPYNPPSNEDVYKEWKKLFDDYNNKVYLLKRKTEYPLLEEQLDALYHDIMSNTLTSNGRFCKLISEVKKQYPKQ
jgi:hypothetical protein